MRPIVTLFGLAPGTSGMAIVGTFQSGFDPHSYVEVYGRVVDEWGNMDGTDYSQAVADGNFLPIASATISYESPVFSGAGTAMGIEGQRLWVFVFGQPEPDNAAELVLCSRNDPSWLAPSDTGSTIVLADTATEFAWGTGGFGGSLELGVVPFPEPSTAALLSSGLLVAGLMQVRRHRSLCC